MGKVLESVVVVPLYKEKPSEKEVQYFHHNCAKLSKYPIVIVAPEGFNFSAYSGRISFQVEYFPRAYFDGIAGYNCLMLSEVFYQRFSAFQYLLICQTDAFIFNDELSYWCRQGYDYVGAPWVSQPFFLFQYVLVKMGLRYAREMLRHNLFAAVGNGGLSLRKVSTFLKVCSTDFPNKYWTANEDFYWSFIAKMDGEYISRPSAKEAALFALECNALKLFKQQDYRLPMGIHAWERYEPQVWRKYVEEALIQ